MHHPTDRIAHTTAFVTPVVDHWLELEIAQWVATQMLVQVKLCEAVVGFNAAINAIVIVIACWSSGWRQRQVIPSACYDILLSVE